MANQQQKTDTSNRGFASMDEDKQREIASMGGKAAHEKGTAHEFSHEEAVAAGRKGGQSRSDSDNDSDQDNENRSSQKKGGQFTSETARQAGQKGGKN